MSIKKDDITKFILYTAVVIIINLVASTLFFRLDLTEKRVYTLSEASVEAVASLKDPLTVHIFLSENLPAPHNNLEQKMTDLMQEYRYESKKYFNYEIHIVDDEGRNQSKEGVPNSELASQYGIQPVEIQSQKQNELSLASVYMGMVVIQGDLSEKVNTLGMTENLEYKITGIIDDISSKTNALLSLDEPIQVKVFFSSVLEQLGSGGGYIRDIENAVDELKGSYFNQLEFEYIDTENTDNLSIGKYNLNTYKLGTDESGETKNVYAALVVELDDEFSKKELIKQGMFGSSLAEPEEVKGDITEIADRLLGVQQKVGYLADNGAPPLYSYGQQSQQGQNAFSSFNSLVSQSYDIQQVSLDDIPSGLKTLIIAGVTEKFSDWELFQIDQFLMNGGSLALFLDSYKEEMPQGQMAMFGGKPQYVPVDTGLKKLLEHHGVKIKQSYLLDKECYVQRQQKRTGGMEEITLYNAPLIDGSNISNENIIMDNIKRLITYNISPLEISEDETKKYDVLFTSSDEAWEMSEEISLTPGTIMPPSEDKMDKYPLSVLVSGTFKSYFDGKEIPQPPENEEKKNEEEQSDYVLEDKAETSIELTESGSKGTLMVTGSSQTLSDQLVDQRGQMPNSVFLMNAIDVLNNRDAYAKMRSKGQMYTPIDSDLKPAVKSFIKIFNIFIIPFLVVAAGILMWIFRNRKKKKIARLFSKSNLNNNGGKE